MDKLHIHSRTRRQRAERHTKTIHPIHKRKKITVLNTSLARFQPAVSKRRASEQEKTSAPTSSCHNAGNKRQSPRSTRPSHKRHAADKRSLNIKFNTMYWTLELASKLEDAPWPATKEELIDYAMRSGAPLEVLENLQEIEDEGEVYDSIEDLWPDYPTKEDFLFNEDEY